METYRNDVRSGVFILVALLVFLFGLFQVGGVTERFKSGRELILLSDNSRQVTEGVDILLLGNKVGKVRAVGFTEDGGAVRILCRIDNGVPLFRGTTARIEDKSALGGKIIELLPPVDRAEPLGPDEPVTAIGAGGLGAVMENANELLILFRDRAGPLFDRLEQLADNLERAVDQAGGQLDNIGQLVPRAQETLAEYSRLAQTLERDTQTLVGKLGNGLDTLVPSARETLADYKQLAATLEQDVHALSQRTDHLIGELEKLSGNADGMIDENREELATLIQSLNRSLTSLEVFSKRIAERPSSIVFSRKKDLADEDKNTAEQ